MAQGQQDNDNGMAPLYVTIIILAMLGAFYYFFKNDIVRFFFIIKTYELKFISIFSPSYQLLINWTDKTLTHAVTLEELRYLALDVGEVLRWPFAIITLVLAFALYKRHPKKQFRHVYATNDVSNYMSKFFPAVLPVLGKKLEKIPLMQGPWSMALSPIEFAKKHKLIIKDENGKNIIKQDRAYLTFVEQLGERWVSAFELPLHRQALFAAFAAFANKDRKQADTIIKEIARFYSTSAKKNEIILKKKIEGFLEKYSETPVVGKVIQSHGYTYTVFTGMLIAARTSGIVSTSSFLWLKPLDRQLWYVLNNVGRRAVYTEAGGIHAHFLCEARLKKAVYYPMINNAIDALQLGLDSVLLDEDDEYFATEKPQENRVIEHDNTEEVTNETYNKIEDKPVDQSMNNLETDNGIQEVAENNDVITENIEEDIQITPKKNERISKEIPVADFSNELMFMQIPLSERLDSDYHDIDVSNFADVLINEEVSKNIAYKFAVCSGESISQSQAIFNKVAQHITDKTTKKYLLRNQDRTIKNALDMANAAFKGDN